MSRWMLPSATQKRFGSPGERRALESSQRFRALPDDLEADRPRFAGDPVGGGGDGQLIGPGCEELAADPAVESEAVGGGLAGAANASGHRNQHGAGAVAAVCAGLGHAAAL